jgi:hypothetical protein
MVALALFAFSRADNNAVLKAVTVFGGIIDRSMRKRERSSQLA